MAAPLGEGRLSARMRSRLHLALLGALLAPMTACDEDDITAPQIIAAIDLSLGDCAGLEVDETCQLVAVARTSEGAVIGDAQLNWDTPDITVATVDFEGHVTGVREGTARIFAKSAPGPSTICTQTGVICDSLTLSVTEPPGPGPGPEP